MIDQISHFLKHFKKKFYRRKCIYCQSYMKKIGNDIMLLYYWWNCRYCQVCLMYHTEMDHVISYCFTRTINNIDYQLFLRINEQPLTKLYKPNKETKELELVLSLEQELNINPDNAEQKIKTLLTFL